MSPNHLNFDTLDHYQDHKTLTQGVVFIPFPAPQGSIIILGFRKLVRFVGSPLFSRKKDKSRTTTNTLLPTVCPAFTCKLLFTLPFGSGKTQSTVTSLSQHRTQVVRPTTKRTNVRKPTNELIYARV